MFSSLYFSMFALVADRNLSWLIISEVFAALHAADISHSRALIFAACSLATCARCCSRQSWRSS